MDAGKKLLILALSLFCLATACKKDSNEGLPAVELKPGQAHQGGIIFLLEASGEHGLIAAAADQSTTAPWWNGSFLHIGATSTTNGSANTTLIINAQGPTAGYAAKICRDYRGGQFSDWFLPSKDQLHALYLQKTLVGGFSNDIYWSSTELEAGSAWVQSFIDGHQHTDNTSDGAGVHTRAIRAF